MNLLDNPFLLGTLTCAIFKQGSTPCIILDCTREVEDHARRESLTYITVRSCLTYPYTIKSFYLESYLSILLLLDIEITPLEREVA